MALVLALGVGAPLGPALVLFAAAWLVAQVLAHAGFPLAHLTYADDGGELGRAGRALWAAAPVALAAALGVAWATAAADGPARRRRAPGPAVLDRSQRLIGEPGAVVRGGIVITADDVTVRNVSVVGGEVGIAIHDAERVLLDDVSVMGASLDGIQARRSQVTIRDCSVVAPGQRLRAGDRHLLRDGAAPASSRTATCAAASTRASSRTSRSPTCGQPGRGHGPARDLHDGDVDGRRSRATSSAARAAWASTAATTPTARSRTTPSSARGPTARPGCAHGSGTPSRRTTTPGRTWTTNALSGNARATGEFADGTVSAR